MKTNNKLIMQHISAAIITLFMFMSATAQAQYGRENYTSKDKFTLFQKWFEEAGSYNNLESNRDYYEKKFSKSAPEGSSAMHKKYNHQIVFSKEPIIYGKEDESKFTTNFKFGDNIYAMAYFSYPIKEFANADNYTKMSLINRKFPDGTVSRGDEARQDLSALMAASQNKAYLSFYLMKPTTDTATFNYSSSMCDYFSKVYFRQNTQFFASVLKNEAFGVFNYDLSGTTDQTYKDMSKVFYKAGEAAANKKAEDELNNIPIPKEWTAKSYPVTGGLTEASIKASYLTIEPKAKCVKLYAAGGSASWVVDKNEIGIPVSQHYTQLIVLFLKQDNYCWQTEAVLMKDYLGGGKYSKLYIKFSGSYAFDKLPCSKMK